MKIAVFHELPVGGAKRAVNQFSICLKKNNTVDLYTTNEKQSSSEEEFYTNTFFRTLKPIRWKGKNWKAKLYQDTIELWKLFLLNKKIAKEIDAKGYDVVFVSASQYIEAPFILRFLKTSFIFYCSDPSFRIVYEEIFAVSKKLDPLRYWYERLNRLNRKLQDRLNVKAAPYCYSPSQFIAKKFSRIYKKQNSVLYYGVDSKFFSPSTRKRDIDIFYMGSYDPVDGLDLLDASIKLMKHKPKVRKLISEEEWISDDKVLLDLYQRSKIMFCPARNEGLGAGPMEAMASGCVVVAVDEAGHKEIILNEQTGYLIPRDPKKAAQVLDSLLSHPSQLASIGKKATENMTKNWSWEKRAEDLERIFLSVTQKRT